MMLYADAITASAMTAQGEVLRFSVESFSFPDPFPLSMRRFAINFSKCTKVLWGNLIFPIEHEAFACEDLAWMRIVGPRHNIILYNLRAGESHSYLDIEAGTLRSGSFFYFVLGNIFNEKG